jgi:shikimate kinase
MKNLDNIFLIGPMGAGKSTIGRRLARKLKLEFLDSDQAIENRTGARIALIFEIEGEEGFRKRESEIIDELTNQSGVVLATGGGAVLDPVNRQKLAERGLVVYLRAGLDKLLKRTARDTKRPLLNTDNPRERIKELLNTRTPLYEEIADLIVDTDKQPVSQIVEEICKYRAMQ